MKLFRFGKTEETSIQLDMERLPEHIAIIMDGNGRWAKKRNLPRLAGHRQGVESLRGIIKKASELGIGYLTLYAFSTENWNRPVDEVSGLMELLVTYLRKEVKELHANQVRIRTLGDLEKLPKDAQKEIAEATELTMHNSGLTVCIALNYGSRYELLQGIRAIASDFKEGQIENLEKIDEALFSSYLYTKDIPDPDLMIRTSGEIRISNFLLWQLAYSELWFTDKFWPDFKPSDLVEAIVDYQNRTRRFGGV